MDGGDSTEIRALENFVLENEDLLELEERIGRFNVFDALRVARVEIRHSNFLAWLLDPAESHGQGDLFLKAVLMDLLSQASTELRPVSPVLLDGADLGGCEVLREWRGIDLLFRVRDPELLVVVENKVGSREGRDQLGRYERTIRELFPDAHPLFVFLTVDGDEPSRDQWLPYTYGDIHRVLTRCRRVSRGAMGDDVDAFLDHYLRLLGSRFMNDPTIDELCRRIYKTHRQALDLIYERAQVGQSGIAGAVAGWVKDSDEFDLVRAQPRRVTFTPRDWIGVLPPIARNRDHPSQWLLCEVVIERRQTRLWFRAWPCTDIEQRRVAIERVIKSEKEFGLKPSFKTIPPKWTQLSSDLLLRWKKDEDPDPEDVLKALGVALGKRIERWTAAVEAAGAALSET